VLLRAARLVDRPPLLLFETAKRAALVGVLVLDQAVDLAAFVPFWQVLGDRKTFRITEE